MNKPVLTQNPDVPWRDETLHYVPITADDFAQEFIRIRGAHNPTPEELDGDAEVRPCAWCRLAGEQAAEAARRLTSLVQPKWRSHAVSGTVTGNLKVGGTLRCTCPHFRGDYHAGSCPIHDVQTTYTVRA